MDLTKPLLFLGTGGAMTTGAYLTKDYWMPSKEETSKSIRDSLEGKKLISTTLTGTALTKQWEEEFESDSDAIKSLLNKSDLNKQTGGEALSKWCDDQMSLDAKGNEGVLAKVEKYCLVRSVSSQLSRKGKNLLGKDNSSGWTTTYNKRKSANANRDVVGLTGGTTWTSVNEGDDISKVKTWCSENSEKDFLVSEQGNSSLYTNVLEWCTASEG
ncbi:hypothetical protein HF1_12460 [Mycoplasma haemofelis str. Langford 1]|uniref:Uncharacterized protein n=1 Tax=Mycoplasma haemofelis (strain Langford 1) TaxID=941640 RepID=E8ZJD3_MYCHL|nr:hypothetical protein [Mycoplasma haemofelis]CBY93254.1 hypothetical protein HF1_12460 [Mycoplasma haemofelis str. Langford 1]